MPVHDAVFLKHTDVACTCLEWKIVPSISYAGLQEALYGLTVQYQRLLNRSLGARRQFVHCRAGAAKRVARIALGYLQVIWYLEGGCYITNTY